MSTPTLDNEPLLDLATALLKTGDSSTRLDLAVEGTMEVVGADRGFLVRTEAEQPGFRVVRNWSRKDLSRRKDRVSTSIVNHVVASDRPVFIQDASVDDRFCQHASVTALRTRSVLAAPLKSAGTIHSVLYLERNRPFESDDQQRFERAIEMCGSAIQGSLSSFEPIDDTSTDLPEDFPYRGVPPRNRLFLRQLRLAARYARGDMPILIHGPSGAGKELVAGAIHEASPRRARPLTVQNCGSLMKELAASALFGHLRGAYTSAERARKGALRQAHRGTLFLDEIGELPLDVQPLLLRALEAGEINPVGSDEIHHVDIRLISATHQNLSTRIEEGAFREDLFYRINDVTIEVPPLRNRPEDIAPLFEHFVAEACDGRRSLVIDAKALETITRYNWPGNVRQLASVARNLTFLSRGTGISEEDLPSELLTSVRRSPPTTLADSNRQLLVDHLVYSRGNIARAAQTLGVTPQGLRKMISRHEIDVERLRD